jgi:hypothetical protein
MTILTRARASLAATCILVIRRQSARRASHTPTLPFALFGGDRNRCNADSRADRCHLHLSSTTTGESQHTIALAKLVLPLYGGASDHV